MTTAKLANQIVYRNIKSKSFYFNNLYLNLLVLTGHSDKKYE